MCGQEKVPVSILVAILKYPEKSKLWKKGFLANISISQSSITREATTGRA